MISQVLKSSFHNQASAFLSAPCKIVRLFRYAWDVRRQFRQVRKSAPFTRFAGASPVGGRIAFCLETFSTRLFRQSASHVPTDLPYTKWRLKPFKAPLYDSENGEIRRSAHPPAEGPIILRPQGATFTKNKQRRTMIAIDAKPYFPIAFFKKSVFTTSLAASFPSIMP